MLNAQHGSGQNGGMGARPNTLLRASPNGCSKWKRKTGEIALVRSSIVAVHIGAHHTPCEGAGKLTGLPPPWRTCCIRATVVAVSIPLSVRLCPSRVNSTKVRVFGFDASATTVKTKSAGQPIRPEQPTSCKSMTRNDLLAR